jgi:DNA-binding transcriptional regulator GbsR (MarR family)
MSTEYPDKRDTVKYHVSPAPVDDPTERIRRDFATAWGRIGASWGVAPSTASVQGYLLLHGGPLTQAELQAALGFSQRAVRVALAECEAWGIVERAPEPRRSGRRGPAGAAWLPVADHWEWFRRVSAARKARETDPVMPLLEGALRDARAAAASDPAAGVLAERLTAFLDFVGRFDRALGAVVRADSAALDRLFGVLNRLDDRTLDRLLELLGQAPEDDLAKAARTLSGLSPAGLRRLLRLAARPGVVRILGPGSTRR